MPNRIRKAVKLYLWSQVLQTIAEFNKKLDDWLISAQSGVHAPEVLHFGTTRVRESDWVIVRRSKNA